MKYQENSNSESLDFCLTKVDGCLCSFISSFPFPLNCYNQARFAKLLKGKFCRFLEMRILPKCFGFSNTKHKNSTQIEELCHRFSLAQLRKSTNNFDENRIIGRGGNTKVYKGCICIQGVAKEIAIKEFKSNSSKGITEFKTEIELLCQLRHPNLVSLIGFCWEKNRKIIVYEYMHNGSLADHLIDHRRVEIHQQPRKPLTWKRRLEICIGAAHGLHYLHAGAKHIIFHRDVKPNNILLHHNWIPKLSNFALSLKGPHFMSKPKPLDVEVAGTMGFLAPECAMRNTLTEKCDVYSFGMVLLVVVCGKDPISILLGKNELKCKDIDESGDSQWSSGNLASWVCNSVQEGKAHGIVDPFLIGKISLKCWKVFMDIAERCLLWEPNERPTMGEVKVELEHALALQEDADHTNPSGDYSLVSTVTTPQPDNAN